MNLKLTSPIAIAAISLSLSCFAQSPDPTIASAPTNNSAMQMVPAQATLKQTLDARKLQPGSTFQAILTEKSQLANGTKLPGGTMLIGQVVTNETQPDGTSRLALRFNSAQLKDGQTLPIHAVIVNYLQPEDANPNGDFAVYPGEQSDRWSNPAFSVNQIDAINGVDMHSALEGGNSAVFVAHPNKDVKLRAGSELALAISAEPAGPAMQSGN